MERSSTSRAAVVYNPVKIERRRLNAIVERAASDAGWGSTLWLPTTPEDPGAGMARQAVSAGAKVVLAVGGDGTVRAVSEGLADSGVPIALVPQGTGNVLARNLQLRLTDLHGAVRLAFDGEETAVDLGLATLHREDGSTLQHAFTVMAGVGLDAEIMLHTSSLGKRFFGWIAYVSGAMRAMQRSGRIRTTISADDEPASLTRSKTVLVCNCGTLPGDLLLVPDADVADGKLDVLAISPRRLTDWIGIARRVLVEHRLRQTPGGRRIIELTGTRRLSTLLRRTGARVDIRMERAVPCELDGDLFGDVTRIETEARPGALRVRIPRGHRIHRGNAKREL